jgi:ParB-like chromosome segregation protein Spo0J
MLVGSLTVCRYFTTTLSHAQLEVVPMTSTDGTVNVDTSSGLERDESTHLTVQQPTPSNSAERTHIALDEIYVPDDRRALQPDKVADLAESIKVLGLLSPIAVRWVRKEVTLPNALTVEGAYHLVYGLHRLTAARQLGWTEIPCQILFSSTAGIETPYDPKMQGNDRQALMAEIAENLHRAELTALERSEHIAAWINLIEENQQGSGEAEKISGELDRRGSGRPKGGRSAAAREIGISEADARRSERIAALPDQVKAEAKELGLDDNQVALLKATRTSDPVRALRDHLNLSREAPLPPPTEPSAAVPADEPEPQAMSAELAAAMEAVKKLSPEDLSAFVWWVRATFPLPRAQSEATSNTSILAPISGWASAAAGLLRARTTV